MAVMGWTSIRGPSATWSTGCRQRWTCETQPGSRTSPGCWEWQSSCLKEHLAAKSQPCWLTIGLGMAPGMLTNPWPIRSIRGIAASSASE